MKSDNGIWIPEEILAMEGFSFTHKGFLAVVKALGNGNGCYASNNYFAERFGVSKDRASKVISDLAFAGAISVEINKSAKFQRTIKIKDLTVKMPIGENAVPSRRKRLTPLVENAARGVVENTEGGTVKTPPGYGENAEQIEKIRYSLNNTTPTAITKETGQVFYSPSGNDVKLPYPSKEFKDAWHVWLLHMAEKDLKPLTRQQERVVLDELSKYAPTDQPLALKIIKYSIKGGWGKICYPSTEEELNRLTPAPVQAAPRMLTRSQGFDARSLFGDVRPELKDSAA